MQDTHRILVILTRRPASGRYFLANHRSQSHDHLVTNPPTTPRCETRADVVVFLHVYKMEERNKVQLMRRATARPSSITTPARSVRKWSLA